MLSELSRYIFRFLPALIYLALPTHVVAQGDERLCELGLKPALGKFTLHWDSFNMFGNRKETFSESGYTQVGQGSSCQIRSQRSTGSPAERPCTWNLRSSCDLQFGKAPVSHSFDSGPSHQWGKLQWATNEKLTVNVRRGETLTPEVRDVAVVKFDGTWRRDGSSGVSVSTLYYDREWGVMLKVDGAHDANKWGDKVTLVEVQP